MLDFTAPPNSIVIPTWLVTHLFLDTGVPVEVSKIGPSKTPVMATSVTLRPLHWSFNEQISNPRQYLEDCLSRNYATLVEGTSIIVGEGGMK